MPVGAAAKAAARDEPMGRRALAQRPPGGGARLLRRRRDATGDAVVGLAEKRRAAAPQRIATRARPSTISPPSTGTTCERPTPSSARPPPRGTRPRGSRARAVPDHGAADGPQTRRGAPARGLDLHRLAAHQPLEIALLGAARLTTAIARPPPSGDAGATEPRRHDAATEPPRARARTSPPDARPSATTGRSSCPGRPRRRRRPRSPPPGHEPVPRPRPHAPPRSHRTLRATGGRFAGR